jgi:Rrf2 family nitric oxide-sensitive transcriptional repressor
MLARDPQVIRLGDVVRHAEPNLRLAECFDRQTNTCPIAPVCALKGMLNEALESFLATLNRYTVADVMNTSGQHKLTSLFATFAGWSG